MAQTYLVEVVLQPTDKNFGNEWIDASALLQAALRDDVPWTYSSRFVVRNKRARTGTGLELWKRALYGVSQIWKERNVALAAAVQEYSERSVIWVACNLCFHVVLMTYGDKYLSRKFRVTNVSLQPLQLCERVTSEVDFVLGE